jgi:hypothetical protein
MLLTTILRKLRRDDQGAALAAVIGLMATGMLMTALVAGSVVTAMGTTSGVRAGVQSQAAAEAGIAAARAGLIAGTCSAQTTLANGAPAYVSAAGSDPEYVASVWRAGASGTWVAGCPTSLATQVRILSTGYAQSTGVNGNSARDTTHLEAVLSAAITPGQIIATGPAVYAYNAGSFGNGGQLVSLDGSTPDVIVKNGDVTCDNNFTATANLVVNGGDLMVDNGCDISGNVWASGRIDFTNSGEVGGYAVGNGVTMANSSRVTKVWSTSYFTTSGNIVVSSGVKAYSMTLGGGTIGGSSYIYGTTNVTNAGATTLGGTVVTQVKGSIPNWWSGNAKITVTNPITSPTFASDVPVSPVVPNWIDFGSQERHFTDETWSGFSTYVMGTSCGPSNVAAAVASFGTQPGIIDGRACIGPLYINQNHSVVLYSDVAIIADQILFDNQGTLTSAQTRRVWLINPDYTADASPTCTDQSLDINNNAQFTNLNVMLYSPCTVRAVAGITIKGQIFSGTTEMTNNSTLVYAAIGLPTFDLNYGSETQVTATEAQRNLSALRNVTAGN